MRQEDFNVERLQYYRLIQRVLCVQNKIQPSDWDLLLYLNPIKLFNRHDFKNGTLIISWDRIRLQRLKREGWIRKVHDGMGWNSGHTKYTVSQKAKLMFARLGRIIDGREELPLIKKPETYRQKTLNASVKKFNNLKYNDYED